MIRAKYIALTVVMLALYIGANAQCPQVLTFNPNNPVHSNTSVIMQLNIHDHFCADGTDNLSDQAAFEAASVFIGKRGGYCKLVIPAGNYLVGRQVHDSAGWYQYPVNVLRLEYVKHVEVEGQGDPVIKYVDGLKYGFFNPLTHLPMNVNYDFLTYNEKIKLVASFGDMIRIRGSVDISVHDLELDGNLYPGKMIIGGRDSVLHKYAGIQEPYSGIYVIKSRGITISRITARRFGLDGLNVEAYPESPLPKTGRIFISDFNSDYNARQGASFVGGDSIFVSRSEFTNTGMGEITYTGLQTGVDIEPELTGMVAEHIFFDSCLFENNRNTNIAITSGQGIARDIHFTNCKSYNVGVNGNEPPIGLPFNNIALGVGRHIDLNFTNCEFRGYVEISKSVATDAAQGYKFMRCLFSDCYQRKMSWIASESLGNTLKCALVSQQVSFMVPPLVFAPERPGGNKWDYVTIDSCVFDVYQLCPWLYIQGNASRPSVIKNSIVYVNTPADPGSFMPGTLALSDDQLTISNMKFFLHNNQKYIHDGVMVAGPGNTATTWNSNIFHRWSSASSAPLPNVCVDTIWVTCDMSPGLDVPDITSDQVAGYQVYPNPATENRFTLKNLNSLVLHYEFLAVNGRLIERDQLNGYGSKEFNLPGLSAGIYYLKVIQDKTVSVEKIVLKQ